MRLKVMIGLTACVIPLTSLAYIDPGSGSALMSAIIGFCVAISLLIKTYWYKMLRFFKHFAKNPEEKEKK